MDVAWGKADREETKGVVVDLCAQCAGLQSHWFCDVYGSTHVQYLPLDRGLYERSFVICRRCSQRTEIDQTRYPQVIQTERADAMSLAEVLEQTNPAVAEALAALDVALDAGAPAIMVARAEAVLFAKRELHDVIASLVDWSNLADDEQENVAAKIHLHWQVAGGPPLERIPIQPGDPGFGPTRPASMLRSIDRKVVILALLLVGFIIFIIVGSAHSGERKTAVARVEDETPIQWVDYGMGALGVGSFVAFFAWRWVQRRTLDDIRRKAGIDP